MDESMWMDYLHGELPEAEREALEQRLAQEPELRATYEALKADWDLLMVGGVVPEPSHEMDLAVESMIARASAKEASQSRWMEQLQGLLGTWVVPRWALGVFLLLIGVGVGRLMGPSADTRAEMQSLTREVQSMQEMMMLTLLEQPAAQDRMRAVSMTERLPQADEKVIAALVHTLQHDDNVNVRLVAVDALARYANHPVARMGLIEAIATQDSPLVQIALAEVMLQLHDSQAIPAFRELLQNPALDTTVQDLVRETIDELS